MAIIPLAKTPAPFLRASSAASVNAQTAAAAPPTVSQVPSPRTDPAGLTGTASPAVPMAEVTPMQPATALPSPDTDALSALSSISSLIQGLMGLTADTAATIQALGPQSGLQVEPVT